MKPRRLTHAPASAKINVTPMIDVVMVLIIFYLLVGQLAAGRRAELQLPRTALGGELGPGDPLVVNVLPGRSGPEVLVDRETYLISELAGLVTARPAGTEIRLRADASLPFGAVRPVIAALRQGGAETIRLSAGVIDRPTPGAAR